MIFGPNYRVGPSDHVPNQTVKMKASRPTMRDVAPLAEDIDSQLLRLVPSVEFFGKHKNWRIPEDLSELIMSAVSSGV